MYQAEQAALAKLDAALSWLTVRAKFAYSRLPSGGAHSHIRELARAVQRRLGMVVVRGLVNRRRWLPAQAGAPQKCASMWGRPRGLCQRIHALSV
jgi:hypothetical protein